MSVAQWIIAVALTPIGVGAWLLLIDYARYELREVKRRWFRR